jgi:hypothetical protein
MTCWAVCARGGGDAMRPMAAARACWSQKRRSSCGSTGAGCCALCGLSGERARGLIVRQQLREPRRGREQRAREPRKVIKDCWRLRVRWRRARRLCLADRPTPRVIKKRGGSGRQSSGGGEWAWWACKQAKGSVNACLSESGGEGWPEGWAHWGGFRGSWGATASKQMS